MRQIEDFVELIFAAVCDTPIARITACVFKDTGRRHPLELQQQCTLVACTRVNRVMLTNLCAETIKPVFEGDKI